ncbi:MAG: UDP-N-acetylmuramate:L-alanyl-gamma-D-glutamyl-meso-diaminopimelate ligase [Pseudomonadota bacterium]
MKKENNYPVPEARLDPELNRAPSDLRHVHLMGICGTGMASLAGLLKQKGVLVTGSDQNVYPPMSLFLENLSIPIREGYRPENLAPSPDLVIVGNVVTRVNPEAVELARLRIPYLSMPQALRAFAMKDQLSIVISGTHGKTTTSALISWILEKAGLDPGFMVGGLLNNFSRNFKHGDGPYFVIEGDEYDTAFFDKGPKFLHYSPWVVILTSLEFDHADIYRDFEHVLTSFRKLIALIPEDGLLIANGDDPAVVAETKGAKCPKVFYGFSDGLTWRAVDVAFEEKGARVDILRGGEKILAAETPLYGRHNLSNLLSAVVLADFLKIDTRVLSDALKGFKGVKRRQEVKGEKGGILVLDDFAHHPTAVRETIRAVKEKFRARRLVALFEPRSNSSRRNIFQEAYATAFDLADLIMIPEPPMMEKIPLPERFSSKRLVQDLKNRGLEALYAPDTDRLLDEVLRNCRKGDVVLIMSNGAFDNLPVRLLERLGE